MSKIGVMRILKDPFFSMESRTDTFFYGSLVTVFLN
jgi:hypothetical protein